MRPEVPADYAAVAALHIRAFERLAEAHIVALLRQRRAYDPELSLVAIQDDQVVGHAFFMPSAVRLLGETVAAVCLAPLAVDPRSQRQGIGAALLSEGHRAAREKGYALSFLLGHPKYYPRFGYKTGAYGVSSLPIMPYRDNPYPLEMRPPVESHLPILIELWQHEEGQVDFAILPEPALTDWLSPNPLIAAEVYLDQGDIIGYTRTSPQHSSIRLFLARDPESARRIAASLTQRFGVTSLPLHPRSASANAFGDSPVVERWDAGMALSLQPNPFDEYYARVQSGEVPPGRPLWGTAFDVG
jgi:predicted N-acetyltransferase YhbS